MLITAAEGRFNVSKGGQSSVVQIGGKLLQRCNMLGIDAEGIRCVSDNTRAYRGRNARGSRRIVVQIFSRVGEIRKTGYGVEARIRLIAAISVSFVATTFRQRIINFPRDGRTSGIQLLKYGFSRKRGQFVVGEGISHQSLRRSSG